MQAWLKRHPRFVPTSSSWLNLVERWFGELTTKAVRRGAFASVADLQSAIAGFLEAWNENPKPFVWTATIESIQAKLARCRQTSVADQTRLYSSANQKEDGQITSYFSDATLASTLRRLVTRT